MAQNLRNRLKKSPPENASKGTGALARQTSGGSVTTGHATWVSSDRRMESRTMAYARKMSAERPTRESPISHSSSATEWRGASSSGSQQLASRAGYRSLTEQARRPEHTVNEDAYCAARGRPAPAPYLYVIVRECVDWPVQAISRTVTAIEHHWALRAVRAEALLDAHERHRNELKALAASFEERRARDLAELNEKHSQRHANHTQMMWIIIGLLGSFLATTLFLLLRQHSSEASQSRRGATHFTIPILSPFASVIEHETSAINVGLVAMLLMAAGIFAFLWFRCGFGR